MKVMIGAAVATLLLAATAVAQTTSTTSTTTTTATTQSITVPTVTATSHCGSPPPAPAVPTGRVTKAQTDGFNAWITAVNTNATCRANEIAELQGQQNSLIQQHNQILDGARALGVQFQAAAAASAPASHQSHNSGH
jgi:hypothetical protein